MILETQTSKNHLLIAFNVNSHPYIGVIAPGKTQDILVTIYPSDASVFVTNAMCTVGEGTKVCITTPASFHIYSYIHIWIQICTQIHIYKHTHININIYIHTSSSRTLPPKAIYMFSYVYFYISDVHLNGTYVYVYIRMCI
jgi:hypothetical protein